MINHLITNNVSKVTFLILLHIILGILSSFSFLFLIVWFYFLFFSTLASNLFNSKKKVFLIFGIVYFSSFDVLGRMASASPFIPYEFSKYFLVIILFVSLFTINIKNYVALLMFLILIPSFIYDDSDIVDFYDLVNNGFGILSLCLILIYFYKNKVNEVAYKNILLLLLYSSTSVLSFAFFKTPKYDDIVFELNAQFSTSGGFGSNQVSTVLGIGACVILIFIICGWKLTRWRTLDFALLFTFIFQGFLTFSRGGLLTILILLIVLIYGIINISNYQTGLLINKLKIFRIFIFSFFLLIIAFVTVNSISDNFLALRYQGETSGTLVGAKEKNINTITSNRYDILLGDFDLWNNNLIIGVGIGASKYLRKELNGVVAHIEWSRMLAEEGLLGLLIIIFWCYHIKYISRNNRNTIYKYINISLFLIAIFTSFHSAMRTYATPILTGISLLTVTPNSKYISKKSN